MFKRIYSNFLMIMFFTAFLFQSAYAGNDSLKDNGEAQDQQSFPFDKQCLKFDKANFKAGQALLDIMETGDFPQYCVLYSLSNYQVKQKKDKGYFIVGSRLGLQHAEATTVFLKSNAAYQQDHVFAGNDPGVSRLVGKWAYFIGPEDITQGNGSETEIYVFQEIDF